MALHGRREGGLKRRRQDLAQSAGLTEATQKRPRPSQLSLQRPKRSDPAHLSQLSLLTLLPATFPP